MDDLISRQAAIDVAVQSLVDWDGMFRQEANCRIRDAINELPSADAVEVVRCGECKHMLSSGGCSIFADSDIRPSASDFCSYGERE